MGAMAAVKVEGRERDGCVTPSPSASSASEGGAYGALALGRMSPSLGFSPADSISARKRTSGPVRRAKGGWTPQEDETLRNAVNAFKGKNWKKIAESFPDRTEVQCLHRWQKVLDPELIKGPWTQEEDETIIQKVKEFGPTKWSVIARSLHGRIGKQCRERWHNHLDPQIKKEAWTVEEEHVLVKAHRLHGNKWAEIAKVLPGRTDNSIKNHWNSSVRKRLDDYNGGADLQVPVHAIHNDLKQVARLPPAENNIDLNKGPNISLRNIKGCSDFLSLSLPTALPNSSCEASVADDSAVAFRTMGLKMDSGHDKDRKINFVCEKGLEINLQNDKGLEIDLVRNKLGHSEPAKSESDRASFGSLCYQIPKLEDTDHVHSPVFSKHQGPKNHGDGFQSPTGHSPVFSKHQGLKNHGDGFQSPTGYSTPSLRDGTKLDHLSVESILKCAAENFPGTPSILRRRKREKPTPAQDSAFKIDTNSDAFDTPIGICITDSPSSFKTAAFLSLGHLDDQRLPAVLGKVDVSPAYRPRSKRMAVLKTIEKHLDFSSDAMDMCDTARILESACRNSESPSTDVSSVQHKKMDGLFTGLETLTIDIAQTTKLGAT